MTVEADIQLVNTNETVQQFERIETTEVGRVRVYYDPQNAEVSNNLRSTSAATMSEMTDEGLFFMEYPPNATVTNVRVSEDDTYGNELIV